MMMVNKHLKSQAFLIVLGLTFFTPSIVHNIRFRLIKSPMSIHIHNFEPPKLAFQDAIHTKQQQVEDLWEGFATKPSFDLNELQSQRKKWNPSHELKSSKIKISEMKFSKEEIQNSIQEKAWVENLPPKLQQRIQLAQEKASVLEQDWSVPTWRDFAGDVIRKNSDESFVQAFMQKPEKVAVYRPNKDGTRTTRKDLMQASVSLMNESVPTIKRRGQVRLYDGLALGDRQIEVRHYEDGIPKEAGLINLKNGSFEIELQNDDGVLVADLIEKNGEIIATGKQNLDQKNENIEIAIRDQQNFAGTFYNFNKSPELLMSEKVNSMKGVRAEFLLSALQTEDKTDLSGSFKTNKISEKSVTLLRAKAPGFSETMMTLVAGEDKNIPLFPQTLIGALRSLANEEKLYQSSQLNGSVVWGQVIYDGKPLQGVSVRILNQNDLLPIYLNGWIPDLKAHETNSNGYFFFTEVPKGMQTILVERNGVYIAHSNVEVDDETTTAALIVTSGKTKKIPLKIFDLFTGDPLQAELQMQSLTELQTVNGQADLILGKNPRLSFGYVQNISEEYMPTQFTYFDDDDYIHIPMMKRQTLTQLTMSAKISAVTDTGIIIGTVPEDDFEVYLSHEQSYENSFKVYFDATGKITESGKMGGGFILFNVPPKTQSVVVISNKTNLVSSKLIPVEPNTTTTLKFHF